MKLISMQDLKAQKGVPFARAHIYRLMRLGMFPKPLKIGASRVADENEQNRPAPAP